VSSPELGLGDTCHLDVADSFGNLVSATPSGGWLQSSPVIPGLGFCLGTRAQMFALTPGLASTLAVLARGTTLLALPPAAAGTDPWARPCSLSRSAMAAFSTTVVRLAGPSRHK